MKKTLTALSLFISSKAFADCGTASTVEDVSNCVYNNLTNVPALLGSFSYVIGIALGIKAVLKLKEHNETKGQTKLHIPIVLILASAFFLALPSLLKVGVHTFGFGSGSNLGGY